jgi:hypothetical protein
VELAAGTDSQLGENLAQVVLDRPGADEQPRTDLRIGQALHGQPGDLGLLGGQRFGRRAGSGGPLAYGLSGRQQFAARPFGERFQSHRFQHFLGGAQLLPGVDAPALAAQPFPVEQAPAGEFGADRGAAQLVD